MLRRSHALKFNLPLSDMQSSAQAAKGCRCCCIYVRSCFCHRVAQMFLSCAAANGTWSDLSDSLESCLKLSMSSIHQEAICCMKAIPNTLPSKYAIRHHHPTTKISSSTRCHLAMKCSRTCDHGTYILITWQPDQHFRLQYEQCLPCQARHVPGIEPNAILLQQPLDVHAGS